MLYLKKQKGFTIVETMIVLGITGVLFVSVSLLISGQTERYRYRDSMYRLQQQVQDQINDVQTGQFYTGIATSDGKSDNELVGKKILFCVNSSDNGECLTNNTQTTFRVDVIQKNPTDYSSYQQFTENLASGIKYIGARNVISETTSDTLRNPFGAEIRFNDDATNQGALNIELYTHALFPNVSNNKMVGYNSGLGSILCFEGYKRGSLELGSKELGNTVKLNLVDSRCD